MYICGVAIGQRPRLGEHQNRPLLEEDWQGIPRLLEEILETCGVGVETGFFRSPRREIGKDRDQGERVWGGAWTKVGWWM